MNNDSRVIMDYDSALKTTINRESHNQTDYKGHGAIR